MDFLPIRLAGYLGGGSASLHVGAGEIVLATGLNRPGENVSGGPELSDNEDVIVMVRSQ
jgi:alpha-glucosidase